MKYADGTPCLVWKLPTGQSEWVEPYTYTQYAASSYAVPHWANYDILYEDGTLCLAASDPEPVTTAPIPADLYIKENGKVYKVDMYRVYKKEQ